MATANLISIDPDIQGGTPCFVGTRVPIRSLFDALKRGRTVDYFLSQFPSVTRNQVDGVLDRANEMLPASEHAASSCCSTKTCRTIYGIISSDMTFLL